MQSIRQLAIIGPTASGKTSLAIKVAQKLNAHILSLDSLAVYKQIDIASAKPSLKERKSIRHFGIDCIYPHEHFDVTLFIRLYQDAYCICAQEKRPLIIVGGTGFYLKILSEGISQMPSVSDATKLKTKQYLRNLHLAYAFLYDLDRRFMAKIEANDRYRIEKALHIYFETSLIPTQYFMLHPPKPIITTPLPIYSIHWERKLLRDRISKRTKEMLKNGLIDEVSNLEKNYSRSLHCMNSIGIKETLAYLDGIYDRTMLCEKITINTARLAKRQNTFNNSQFKDVIKGSIKELERLLLSYPK